MAAHDVDYKTSADIVLPRPPAPPRMRDLDFLLGECKREYTNTTPDPATPGFAYWTTAALCHGHFYEMTQKLPEFDINGKWIFGWDEEEEKFVGFYYDDYGNLLQPSSTGFDDGRIAF